MKRIITALVVALVAGLAFGAPSYYTGYTDAQAGRMLGGEHTPLIWTGSDTISSSANFGAYTTSWMQIGYSPNVTASTSALSFNIHPKTFTIEIWRSKAFATAAVSDCTVITSARFELADSSAATFPFWNSDSSNLFIASGNYNRTDYGTWTGLCDTLTTRGQIFPLKVYCGSFIRFVFATTIQDCTIVHWTFKADQ